MQASLSRSVIGPAGQAGGGSKQIDAPMSVKGSDDVLNLSISVFRECCSGWGC